MKFKIKVITKASKNTVEAVDSLLFKYKVYTNAVAEKNQANIKVLELLANYLRIKPNTLTIVAGAKSNIKTIAVDE